MADAIGTRVSATNRLARREKAMVSAISVNSCLVSPSVKIMGTNTMIVVSVDAVMAPLTCLAPSMAALLRSTP